MANLVELNQYITFYASYQTVCDAQSTIIELQAAKERSRARLGSLGKKPIGTGGAPRDQ